MTQPSMRGASSDFVRRQITKQRRRINHFKAIKAVTILRRGFNKHRKYHNLRHPAQTTTV
ncbi:MAG: hypothetical protein EAZ65_00405 [Verrucomicrobia bacterium]|nr:MAG: hypothetical protein EAZ84_00280 [Verrucomicrobiota bacterium]TAE89323.1 MAG: hypothetical protein EAZ82_01490 [Verrucomicrobiota bacterium]TAF27801.1 MAG: hypothetical protein EAZ71_00410 [Verrucomicrobiota bacterium]TAF42650.1 MAG: hypothetical protein EAZ65_00405 [Verrucomicrobiota bacterium]